MVIGLLLGVVFGLVGGGVGAAYAIAAARARDRAAMPRPPDPNELVTRLLEANRTLLEQERLRATSELDGKKGLIDQQLVSMTGELGKVNDLVRELEHDRHKAFGELHERAAAPARRAERALGAHPTAPRGARELAGARPVGRADGGRRAAARGLSRGRQLSQAGDARERRARPDYTFLLPNGLVMHMDVKFPLDNYVRYLEADERRRAGALPRPVPARRARPGEGAHRPAATSTAADETVDCLLLFIPNEQVYASCRSTTAMRSTTPCGTRSCCARRSRCTRCSRSSARPSTTSGSSARRTRFSACCASSRCSGRSTPTQLDRVQQRFDGVAKEYSALMTTRHRALQRPLDKIESLRLEEPALVDTEIVPVRARSLSRSLACSAVQARVAVLGGGQLGWMLGLAGIPLGCDVRVPRSRSPARPRAAVGELVVGALDDVAAAQARPPSARPSSPTSGKAYRRRRPGPSKPRAPVYPSPNALDVAQDRIVEKTKLRALGIATAPFVAVDSADDLRAAVAEIGLPAILKTRRGGYDGKGQARAARTRPPSSRRERRCSAVPCILEGFVAFDRELSIVAVRGPRRRDPVLARGREPPSRRHPAPHARARARSRRRAPGRAEAAIRPLLDDLDYVGVCCVELFDVGGDVARERDRAARAQLRALDDRRRGDEPVREPSARHPRPPARLHRAARSERNGQLHRRDARPRRGARAFRARICTTTPRPRVPGARSATSP